MTDDEAIEFGLRLKRRLDWFFWALGFGPRPKRREYLRQIEE